MQTIPPLFYTNHSLIYLYATFLPFCGTTNWAKLINSTNPKYLDEVPFEANDKYESNYNKALNFVEKYRQNLHWCLLPGPGSGNNRLTENFYNSNKNTYPVITWIFGIKKLPESWTGEAPKQLFK